MTIELAIPEEWTPAQALAMRALLQHVLWSGQPVVGLVRKDATPEQIEDIILRLEILIQEAGLTA